MSTATSIDTGEFRKALGAFTTGVTIVTTHFEKMGDVGLTANSFNSVSLDPPMVLWSLAKTAGSLQAFKNTEYFAVHILSEDQQELSNRFAQRGVDKFSNIDIQRGPENIPLIEGCAAQFTCKTAYQYEGGDHLIFVGEVVNFRRRDRSPLLFHDGEYGQINKPENTNDSNNELKAPDDALGMLLRRSYQKLIEPLLGELEKKSLSIGQHYFLALVSRSSNRTFDELQSIVSTSSGRIPLEEYKSLMNKGLIEESDNRIHLTEQGMKIRVEIASIYQSIESDILKNFGYDKTQSLKILLNQLLDSIDVK